MRECMKKNEKIKKRLLRLLSCFLLLSAAIFLILQKRPLQEKHSLNKIQRTERIETETTLSMPDIREKIWKYKEIEEQKEEMQEKKIEEKIKNLILPEDTGNAVEESSTTPLIIPEEKPTIITNGEDSSFISNGRIDENGNIVSIKSKANSSMEKKESEYIPELISEEKEDMEKDTIEKMTETTSQIVNTNKTEFNSEEFWKNSGSKVNSETAEFELTGIHTGY